MAHLVKMLAYLARKSQSYFDSFVTGKAKWWYLSIDTGVKKIFNNFGSHEVPFPGKTEGRKWLEMAPSVN